MQALGSYEGGRMLFLGLGTGLGSALIADHTIIALELGDLPWRERGDLGDVLSASGLERAGLRAWRKGVGEAASSLMKAFLADYVVIGGGNAQKLKTSRTGSASATTRPPSGAASACGPWTTSPSSPPISTPSPPSAPSGECSDRAASGRLPLHSVWSRKPRSSWRNWAGCSRSCFMGPMIPWPGASGS